MKKFWIICAVAGSLALGFALPAVGEEQNVAGTWNGTMRVRQAKSGFGQDEFTMVLKQEGQAVTGTWSQKMGGTGSRAGQTFEGVPVTGTLTGDKLSLKIGQQRWFDATVTGDSMSGKTAFGNNTPSDVTGSRAK
jgi:hypothetical protein